ncbi:isoprenyl transferase [Methylacidimicrobium tartarophylax]|uniref:Isoprenyl transferase n=1 Tax=Methylacidimicrobium tartarophylax TaxID=1041768 RepID=A0A5E6MFL7_9BACT|nr:isoprenyl transferase [Methylacidimicrobium tartarophylax]VVM04838.1 undecaprenyl diphosphate synthase [Methylacidimicrobium tartarophylax]
MQAKPPTHVAIIMDGNGRWARARNLPRVEGHRAGFEAAREVVRTAAEIGIGFLTLYAFSVENWKRPVKEVNALMELLNSFVEETEAELIANEVRLKVIGRVADLPAGLREKIDALTLRTAEKSKLTLSLALSYSGRIEIVTAVRRLTRDVLHGRLRLEEIDETSFRRYLYTGDDPDPDLLIRTSGEMRLSNFLLWQISYSEIYFTDVLWPDFRREAFLRAVEEYGRRQRRFGQLEREEFE